MAGLKQENWEKWKVKRKEKMGDGDRAIQGKPYTDVLQREQFGSERRVFEKRMQGMDGMVVAKIQLARKGKERVNEPSGP